MKSVTGWVTLGLSLAPMSLWAGTYNFYFNNTEQGDNSTATPSLVIRDGKDLKEGKQVEEAKGASAQGTLPSEGNTSAAPSVTPGVQSQKDSKELDRFFGGDRKPYFRFMGGAAGADFYRRTPRGVFDSDPDSDLPFWKQTHEVRSRKLGFSASASYFPTSRLGFSLLIGDLIGTEMEFAPLGSRDVFFQPALLGGIGIGGMGLPSFGPIAYVGASIQLNFVRSVGLTMAIRKDLPVSEDLRIMHATAGLAFQL